MRYVVALLITAAVVVFAAVVWPTPWRFYSGSTRAGVIGYRVNRFTGAVDALDEEGWQRTSSVPNAPAAPRTAAPLDTGARARLDRRMRALEGGDTARR